MVNLVGEAASSSGVTGRNAIKRLRSVAGYEKVTSTMIRKWQQQGPVNKRGRKINTDFEVQIIAQFVFTSLATVDSVEVAVVEANVAHSHLVITQAAKLVQRFPAFQKDTVVQSLKFSRTWVRDFLLRAALRRRRVTASEKQIPKPELVRERMTQIQKVMDDGGYTLDERISADETGVFFGAPNISQIRQRERLHQNPTRKRGSPQTCGEMQLARWGHPTTSSRWT